MFKDQGKKEPSFASQDCRIPVANIFSDNFNCCKWNVENHPKTTNLHQKVDVASVYEYEPSIEL